MGHRGVPVDRGKGFAGGEGLEGIVEIDGKIKTPVAGAAPSAPGTHQHLSAFRVSHPHGPRAQLAA
jgi:hypothetical protein